MNPLTPCCHFTSGDLEGGCYQTESVLDDAYMYVLGSVFAFLTIPCYIIFCFMVRCFREKRRNVTTMERSLDEGDEDDLVVFDEGSVYSYFVTDMPLGWLIAFVSLGLQFAILFLLVSFYFCWYPLRMTEKYRIGHALLTRTCALAHPMRIVLAGRFTGC